ncbi:hypothetical protein TNCV_148321 [Trichonephila clavipes]|nr:hypothetical protein TNCV_148321 [Trichonephila clavipes]
MIMRGRIIGKIEKQRKITDVAKEFDIPHIVVSRLWKSFKTTGMCSRRHVGGRVVRSTTPAEDIYRPISKEQAPQLSREKSVSCCLKKADLPKKTVGRRFEEGRDYTHADLLCVSH